MVDEIINKYYSDNAPLRGILLRHSTSVAEHALAVAERHPELEADKSFIYEAAMLHDIGIYLTDAPGIQCFGRVAERHTGTGLTADVIVRQGLPLPPADYTPETIEEQIICYSDKFFSKSHLERVRTNEQVLESLRRFGEDGLRKMREWMIRFG